MFFPPSKHRFIMYFHKKLFIKLFKKNMRPHISADICVVSKFDDAYFVPRPLGRNMRRHNAYFGPKSVPHDTDIRGTCVGALPLAFIQLLNVL